MGLFGLVVVATRATGYLLTKEIVAPQLKPDQNPKLMILDLSIPRNVSPDLGELKGIVIKTIDDLRDITDQALSTRTTLVKEAEPKVEEAAAKISALLRCECGDSDGHHSSVSLLEKLDSTVRTSSNRYSSKRA